MSKPANGSRPEPVPTDDGSPDITLLRKARAVADGLLRDHPVLPSYKDHLSVLIVGSLGSGYADDRSDIDLWVMCSEDVTASLSEQFAANDLRFNELPPHTLDHEGTDVHYFALPIDKLRHGLEIYDDGALYIAKHCLVCHDANNQFAALAESIASLPPDVLREKVTNAYSQVRMYASSLADLFQRYQPSVWLQCASDLIHHTLSLVCWLDGQAPSPPKWAMRQAQSCSAAHIIVPILKEVLRAMGSILDRDPVQTDAIQPLLTALGDLDAAARQALDASGYADVPTPGLRRAF